MILVGWGVVEEEAQLAGLPVLDADAVALSSARDHQVVAVVVSHPREAVLLVVGDPGVVGEFPAAGERLAVDFDLALAIFVADYIDTVARREAVGVISLAALQPVAVFSADEYVVAVVAEELVVAVAAVEAVVVGAADELVI
ncbi:MAG TPA: hypothetical protein PJ981_10240, partial [Accumulibacter sp.]|nr:hypothetical protein [Accumulibacter sp.]